MRTIKYYDRINKKYVDLEVNDEVALFLMSNDKWLRRKQNQFNYYNLSIYTGKLDGKQYDLIGDIFVEKKSQKQLAEEFHTTESNISPLKSTALTHLTYHFYADKDFIQTDLYIRNKREFEADYIKIVKEIDKEEGLTFNLNNIFNLVKDNTQMLKNISSLGIKLDEE